MASRQLGCRAFSHLLGKDVMSFHRVLWNAEPSNNENSSVVYLIMTKTEFLIIQIEDDQLRRRTCHVLYCLSYALVDELLVHDTMEDRFFFSVVDTRPRNVPPVLYFSSCYRKAVTESFQVLHNIFTADIEHSLTQLKVSFVGREDNPLRHVAVKMFSDCPSTFYEQTRMFYRRGYMFLAPRGTVDQYDLLDNRPCSTYVFRPIEAQNETNVSAFPHTIVRFLPEKPVSSTDRMSFLEFQLLVENIAHAIAQVRPSLHVLYIYKTNIACCARAPLDLGRTYIPAHCTRCNSARI